MAFKNRGNLGRHLSGAMQLTLGDALENGEVDGSAPLWALVFPDGRCLYRNSDGDVVPALALSQILGITKGLTIDHYDVGPPFQMPGVLPLTNELDEDGDMS